jgi:hypothetical protein
MQDAAPILSWLVQAKAIFEQTLAVCVVEKIEQEAREGSRAFHTMPVLNRASTMYNSQTFEPIDYQAILSVRV